MTMQQTFKESLTLEIPAASVLLSIKTYSGENFFKYNDQFQKDPYNFRQTLAKAEAFIDEMLEKQGMSLDRDIRIFLSETINNAYDAHLNLAKLNRPLTIKIVVKNDLHHLMVNIMDNSAGFLNQPKSILFKREDLHEAKKDREFYIGGMGIGLRNLERSITAINGSLFFKNRKEQGATVSIQLPLTDPASKMKTEQEETITHDTPCNIM